MGDKQTLQRGNRVSIDNKGRRTETPLEEGEIDAQIAANKRSTVDDVGPALRSMTLDRAQKMPNRRDKVIDDAMNYAKGGSVDGCAQRGKTKGRMR